MGTAIDGFFASLAAQGQVPLLRHVSDTLRVDVVTGPTAAHWFLTVRDGAVEITRADAPANAVLRADEATLDGNTFVVSDPRGDIEARPAVGAAWPPRWRSRSARTGWGNRTAGSRTSRWCHRSSRGRWSAGRR
jgi:hypothetical protein